MEQAAPYGAEWAEPSTVPTAQQGVKRKSHQPTFPLLASICVSDHRPRQPCPEYAEDMALGNDCFSAEMEVSEGLDGSWQKLRKWTVK